MTPVNHTPQGFDVALGIVFAVLGAYALFSGEAGLPSALGLLTTKEKTTQSGIGWLLCCYFCLLDFVGQGMDKYHLTIGSSDHGAQLR